MVASIIALVQRLLRASMVSGVRLACPPEELIIGLVIIILGLLVIVVRLACPPEELIMGLVIIILGLLVITVHLACPAVKPSSIYLSSMCSEDGASPDRPSTEVHAQKPANNLIIAVT